MKLTDIIALATKGYKPSDIRDLIDLANESEKLEAQHEEETVPAEEQKDPEPEEAAPDYAAEIESLKKETERLRADLKAAQEANRSMTIPEEPRKSRSEELADIARAMMR